MRVEINRVLVPVTVLGAGRRVGLWVQGCGLACHGCASVDTWAAGEGYVREVDELAAEIVEAIERHDLDGLTLTGGEPFEQPEACLELALGAKSRGLTVWAYSGYTYEALMKKGGAAAALLDACDVLVDGPFVLAQRSLELDFRGSRNQRLVDVPQSRRAGQATLWQRPSW